MARNTRRVRRAALLLILLALAAAGCGGDDDPKPRPAQVATTPVEEPAPPSPRERLPRSPRVLAERLAGVSGDLRRAIEAWLATDPGARDLPPEEVQLRALYQQRIYRRLARRRALRAEAIPLLPRWLRGEARDETYALRDLFRLTSPTNESRFRTQPPLAPGVLLGFYRKAQRRFDVGWHVLAAVNLVETNFGRLSNSSSAGAQGPMQFIPATWRAYGMGGDVHDPHDAILGAANYLSASGAPGDLSRALFAYNNSLLYVRAVRRFARRMARDRRALYALWSWQVFVRTRDGDRQLTGPGAVR
jgi:hypothetical protein